MAHPWKSGGAIWATFESASPDATPTVADGVRKIESGKPPPESGKTPPESGTGTAERQEQHLTESGNSNGRSQELRGADGPNYNSGEPTKP